ncbi:MAG: NYN domain-containing protein [Verrucomicrobiota bacterium]
MASAKHLLVDGPNILHAWPELRALLRRDRDAARSQLRHRLTAIHDTEAVCLTLVFDGRGPELRLERPSQQETFTVLFTPSRLTADDVIEQLVARAAAPRDCYVATADQTERRTVEALGALVVAPDELAAWCARAETRLGTQAAALRRHNTQEWRRPAP